MKFKVSSHVAVSQSHSGIAQPYASCASGAPEMNVTHASTVTQSKESPTSRANPPTTAEELAKSLEMAVNAGLTDQAAEIATKMAMLKMKLDVQVSQAEMRKETEFSVKVHVEDRVSDKCYFNLSVKASNTIADLKRKVMLLHNFPTEVQRWIIGKKIFPDEMRLQKCGVKNAGHTLYLYLVTARSVGLSRAKYEAQLRAIQMMNQTSVPGPSTLTSQTSSSTGYNSFDIGSHNYPGPGPGQHSTMVLGDSLEQTLPWPPTEKQTSHQHHLSTSSSNSASVRIQEMLHSPNLAKMSLSPPIFSPSSEAEDVMTHASPGLGADTWAPITNSKSSDSNDNNSNNPASNVISSSTTTLQDLFPMHYSGEDSAEEDEEQEEGWVCPACTFRNLPMWPGCEICNHQRPEEYQVPPDYEITDREKKLLQDEQKYERLTRQEVEEADNLARLTNYQTLLETEEMDLIPNQEPFQCPICFDDIEIGDGIVLRECLHMFCRECLTAAVQHCEDAILTCPYKDDQYSCNAALQEREIRHLVPMEMFFKYLQRGLDQAEVQMQNSYHCKTPNCPGWCIYEDMVNFFTCEVCGQQNCLTCKAIHPGKNCQQYQTDLRIAAVNDASARETHEMLQNLVASGEAMHCPQCQVIVQKKGGCDWISCSICKTEICWITKGPRWGPKGQGDYSGGCKCHLNGKKCHPNCNNCH